MVNDSSKSRCPMLCDLGHPISNKNSIRLLLIIGLASLIVYYFYCKNSLRHRVLSTYTNPEDDDGQTGMLSDQTTLRNLARMDKFQLLEFDIPKNHIFVYLHIQKTGGTRIEKMLVEGLHNAICECNKPKGQKLSCDCSTDIDGTWIICRYARIGGHNWPCGLHADWTELQHCAPRLMRKVYGKNEKRQFLFITQLRNPLTRFVSEFKHVQRGANWKGSHHLCKEKYPKAEDIYCFEGDMWRNVTFDEFVKCRKNLALNRQTRMLSNLELVDCYNSSAMSRQKRDNVMLHSAMMNLMSMPYFGLLEQPSESQFLFEKTFHLKFRNEWKLFDTGYASVHMNKISKTDVIKAEKANYLDIVLYEFAKIVFKQRLDYVMKAYQEKPLETKISKNPKAHEVLKSNFKKYQVKKKKSRRKKVMLSKKL